MSGGAFDYKQWHIEQIADEVDVNFLHRMFEQGYSFNKISKKLLAGKENLLNFVK